MIFKDKYFFLNTFSICNISLVIDGKLCKFTNVEAAYQAQKIPEIADRFSQVKGLEAKRMDDRLKITVPDWNNYKLYAMGKALHEKFKNPMLLIQLKCIKTDIVNDTLWGDDYWGVYKGKGHNFLGKMLTNIRDNNNNLNKLNEYITSVLLEENKEIQQK